MTAGGAKGGLGGAIVGGLLGGMAGSIFGEPIHELRQRMWNKVQVKIEEIDNHIVQVFNSQIPEIRNTLLSLISENYFRNKKNAALLLSYEGENAANSQESVDTNFSNPDPEIKWINHLFAYASIISVILVISQVMLS